MTVGLTGASGQLATSVLHHLLGRVPAADVVAVTRTPAKVEAFAARGVRVRAGDFDNRAPLEAAFEGIERLLIIPASDLSPGVRPRQHRTAIEAAAAAGVRHVIYVSSVGARPGPPDGILETHFATEQALITSGLPWTLLRMNVYADFQIEAAKRALASGVHTAPDGAPLAYVVRDDLGAAAAAILATPGHDGITYHGTGPVSVTHAEIATTLARATGKPVRYEPTTLEQAAANLAAAGLPPVIADALVRFERAGREGAFDLVNGDIERLTGRKAQSALDFLGAAFASTGRAAPAP